VAGLMTKCERNAETVRCEALFASPLQGSDIVTSGAAIAEIRRTIRELGVAGCASRMAQEFGDHPVEAHDRMLWVHQVVSELPRSRALPVTTMARRAA
jgi:hypothetical protein